MRVLLLFAILLVGDHTPTSRARFRVGQVVAVDVVPGDHEYFRVGFIDSALEVDGRIHYKYTDAQRRIGGEWPEESLRALSLTECGR